jgi:hypothetical protein
MRASLVHKSKNNFVLNIKKIAAPPKTTETICADI